MNTLILDIHHHGPPPRPDAVNSVMAGQPLPEGNCLFSMGIHPWQTDNQDLDKLFEEVTQAVADPRVVAIGETGIDRLRGADTGIQTEIFNQHVQLALSTGKPLIIHAVRATDLLLPGLKKASAHVPVIIHGFRGKPVEAMQLVNSGAYISLGERFNPETAAAIPAAKLLAETDESPLPIQAIISKIAEARRVETARLEKEIILTVTTVLTASKS